MQGIGDGDELISSLTEAKLYFIGFFKVSTFTVTCTKNMSIWLKIQITYIFARLSTIRILKAGFAFFSTSVTVYMLFIGMEIRVSSALSVRKSK